MDPKAFLLQKFNLTARQRVSSLLLNSSRGPNYTFLSANFVKVPNCSLYSIVAMLLLKVSTEEIIQLLRVVGLQINRKC